MRQAALFALALAAAAPASAQTERPGGGLPTERSHWTRGLIHYGKWATAGAAVALTAMGAREHSRSKRHWDRLLDICRANNADCTLGPDGRYTNAVAEQEYQQALHFDRRANRRFLGGQVSLLATAALFIADLRGGGSRQGPKNIPLAPLEVSAEPAGDAARVGLRFAF